MRLLLINPNTSASITDLIVAAARRAASPDVELVGTTAAFGARYIGSRAAAAIAGHAALDAYARAMAQAVPIRDSEPNPAQAAPMRDSEPQHDGVMLACFGDPGLLALREMAPCPVAGMADSSCRVAARMGARFSIITGGALWGPMLQEFVAMIGLAERLASVRTVAPTGAEIAANPQAAYALLSDACNAAVSDDGADVVILGGAGLLGIAEKIAHRVPVPLLDCMAATMGDLEASVRAEPRVARRKAPSVETIGLSDGLKAQMER